MKKQNLLPLIKEKGEFVAQQRKTAKQGEQENRATTGTGEQGKQGNKGRRNCDFVYKLLMQNFSSRKFNSFRVHVGNMSFDVWRKGHVDAHAW